MIYEHIMWYHVQQVVEKLCRTLHDEPLCRTLCRTLFFLCFFNIKWIKCPKKYDIWTYHMISWANFNIMGGFGTFWIISVSMTHRPPGIFFFLDLRLKKWHGDWKNNSQQFLLWCCYSHFFSFGRKSRFCSQLLQVRSCDLRGNERKLV